MFPFIFMALRHRTTPFGPPKYKITMLILIIIIKMNNNNYYYYNYNNNNNNKKYTGFPRSLADGYAMLMNLSKGETGVHGCHCPRDLAVSMR